MIVKCDACQGELSTTEEGLRLGRRSKCPKCSTDLRPTHDDPACGFCKGEGMVRVGRSMSICRSDS
jgi:hypothetical protein